MAEKVTLNLVIEEKDAIIQRLKRDGYDPSGFTFYFLSENTPDGVLDSRSLEDLPEDFDSFCCRGKGGSPIYNFDRYKNPRIEKVRHPEEV